MSTEKPYPASAPPSEDAWLQPRDVEVSWLGVIDRLLPSRRSDASGAHEAVSPLTVAGAAPASLSHRCSETSTQGRGALSLLNDLDCWGIGRRRHTDAEAPRCTRCRGARPHLARFLGGAAPKARRARGRHRRFPQARGSAPRL